MPEFSFGVIVVYILKIVVTLNIKKFVEQYIKI